MRKHDAIEAVELRLIDVQGNHPLLAFAAAAVMESANSSAFEEIRSSSDIGSGIRPPIVI
jgi:hypothetical protein